MKKDFLNSTSAPPSEVVTPTVQIGKRPPRICVCIPSGDQWKSDMGVSLAGMMSYSMMIASMLLLNETSSMITMARNNLTKKALDLGAEWIMMIDSDMKFPPNTLQRLLAHDKDIVAATYNKRTAPYSTLGHFIGQPEALHKGGLMEADFLPAGMLLVRRKVFETVKWPWFFETYDEPGMDPPVISEDYNFIRKARAAGFRAWCDLDLTWEMGHIGSNTITCDRPAQPVAAKPVVYA